MLIKIDNERYINSDHISIIEPHPEDANKARLVVAGIYLSVPFEIVDYITQSLDANTAFTSEQPINLSLESQIAQYLRNQSEGKLLGDIIVEFTERIPFDEDVLAAVQSALAALQLSNTVRTTVIDNSPLYYHASHPLFAGATEQW